MKKKNIINLIRYHVENNEMGFRNEAYEIARDFDASGDFELSEYVMSLLSNANTFVPQMRDSDVKSPYFENLTFDIISKQKLEHDGMQYYFLTVKANLECYGNGNFDRQFALNMYDDLLGKYETQFASGLIDNEQISYIRDTINNRIYVTMDGFISQIDGAYVMNYVYNIIRSYLNDDNTDHTALDQFLTDKLFEFYDKLSDFNSFAQICFDDQNEVMQGVEEATGKKLEELAQQYQIDVVDLLGNAMSEEDIQTAQANFINNQNNYTLHADFLNYVYQEMKSLNQEFNEFKYNNSKKK